MDVFRTLSSILILNLDLQTVKSLTEIALADITNVNTTKAMHSIRTLAAITQKDDKDGMKKNWGYI